MLDTSEATKEDILELFQFSAAKEVIAALKFGFAPFVGFVMEYPSESNRNLLFEALTLYDKLIGAICEETGEDRELLIKELRGRLDEINTGIIEDTTKKEDVSSE